MQRAHQLWNEEQPDQWNALLKRHISPQIFNQLHFCFRGGLVNHICIRYIAYIWCVFLSVFPHTLQGIWDITVRLFHCHCSQISWLFVLRPFWVCNLGVYPAMGALQKVHLRTRFWFRVESQCLTACASKMPLALQEWVTLIQALVLAMTALHTALTTPTSKILLFYKHAHTHNVLLNMIIALRRICFGLKKKKHNSIMNTIGRCRTIHKYESQNMPISALWNV